MKKLILILLLICTPCFAVETPDKRICDNDGHCLNITATGKVTYGANGTTTGLSNSKDFRICDDEGDCLLINADGSVNGVVGSPY
jgi:hypothetical protein